MEQSKQLKQWPTFLGLTLDSLAEEISLYLQENNAPKYDEFLFSEDWMVTQELQDVPVIWEILGWTRSKLSKSLFKTQEDFKEHFQYLRTEGSDWMHVKVHGVLDGKMLVTFQTSGQKHEEPPEKVLVRMTKCDKKPKWRFSNT